MSIALTPADANARLKARSGSTSVGAIIASNSRRVSRTSLHTPGRATGMATSLSSERPSLAVDALLTQPGKCGGDLGLVAIHRRQRVGDGPLDVGHDGVVEVDAAETLEAGRLAERLEAGLRAPQHGDVEGAAAEVVHGDDLTDRHTSPGGVVHGGGDRLGDEGHVAYAARIGRLAQQVDLELAPVRRV